MTVFAATRDNPPPPQWPLSLTGPTPSLTSSWHKNRLGMGCRTRRAAEYLLVAQKPPQRAKGIWQRHDIPDVWKEKPPARAPAPQFLTRHLCAII